MTEPQEGHNKDGKGFLRRQEGRDLLFSILFFVLAVEWF